MASGFYIHCSACNFRMEAWDDGNPYIVDRYGERQFCYHPGGDDIRARVQADIEAANPDSLGKDAGKTGNESVLLCLDCAHTSRLDPETDALICPKCKGPNLRDQMELQDMICPKCKKGSLEMSGPAMIS